MCFATWRPITPQGCGTPRAWEVNTTVLHAQKAVTEHCYNFPGVRVRALHSNRHRHRQCRRPAESPGGTMPPSPLGRTSSSEPDFQEGVSLSRKMSERASKLKAMHRGPNQRARPAGARTTDTFSTTLHGCLTTQSCGFAVNADNVMTAVRQNSPATACGLCSHAWHGIRAVRTRWVRIPAS